MVAGWAERAAAVEGVWAVEVAAVMQWVVGIAVAENQAAMATEVVGTRAEVTGVAAEEAVPAMVAGQMVAGRKAEAVALMVRALMAAA
jgi:hypothetical protein